MSKKTIEDIQVSGKKILVRCDFNVPLDGDGNKLEEDAVSGGLAKDKKEITLETAVNGNGIQKYRLDWQWPLNGNDAEDTAAGNAGGTYMLSLSIHAEEEN